MTTHQAAADALLAALAVQLATPVAEWREGSHSVTHHSPLELIKAQQLLERQANQSTRPVFRPIQAANV